MKDLWIILLEIQILYVNVIGVLNKDKSQGRQNY